MEKNNDSSGSMGPCEKTFNAMAACPVIQKIRRISNRPQSPLPATSSAKPSLATHSPAAKPVPGIAQPQPIAHKAQAPVQKGGQDTTVLKEDRNKPKVESVFPNASVVEKPKSKPKVESAVPDKSVVGKNETHEIRKEDINDRFNDYISRAKIRIRAMSNVGRAGSGGGGEKSTNSAPARDHLNDRVSDYIKRAKIKIRTTSSRVGSDKKKNSFK